jgi:hypothetical protein
MSHDVVEIGDPPVAKLLPIRGPVQAFVARFLIYEHRTQPEALFAGVLGVFFAPSGGVLAALVSQAATRSGIRYASGIRN